ncbi:MAG TPA: nucleoside hydrolase [Aggregatilineales bacterium]|nr:nucleoside hydrolase [Aggregatilineales bacterium]
MLRLVIDTDAGVDDAEAIMMALRHPAAQVEAITTLTGNCHVDKVVPNVLTVLDMMNAGPIPVYRGAERPLVSEWFPESEFHGKDGLGDAPGRQPSSRPIEAKHAALALIDLANAHPGELTLVALGPLTNLALAIRLDPALPSKFKAFTWMGGSIRAQGNTPNITAEWNAFCDPEAVQMVLEAFPMTTLLSWEATLDNPLQWDQFDKLCAIESPVGRFHKAITYRTSEFIRQYRASLGFLLPDPLAMAITLEPDLIAESFDAYVTGELQGKHTRGMTVVDHLGRLNHPVNARVVTKVDMAGVYRLFEQMLA